MLRTFIESGWGLGEVAGLTVEDVDFEYVPLRSRHPQASSPALWLGPKGPMTESGIAQMLERRCGQAGMDKVHPHQLRHTAAHTWLAAGGPRCLRCATSAGAAARCCPDMEPAWLTSALVTKPTG